MGLLACSTLKHMDSPVVVERQHLMLEMCWFAKRQATLASWLNDNVATEAQQACRWWVSLNACIYISTSGQGDSLLLIARLPCSTCSGRQGVAINLGLKIGQEFRSFGFQDPRSIGPIRPI